MTVTQILEAFARDRTLCDRTLAYLNYGMQDEWDCTLPQGLELGFGGHELQIAAHSAFILAKTHKQEGVL